jgi:predicted dehydrogenase
MNSRFGWAILGPGVIAHRFAEAVHHLPDTHIAIVQGRDLARAKQFANAWCKDGITQIAATHSLDEAIRHADVNAVYIATPHAFHADLVRAALLAGKAVLCEKPLVPNANIAAELTALAKSQNVFLMEAMWTRFLPIYQVIGECLSNNTIGKLRGMQSSFCFNVPWNPEARHFDPLQAGGCLLDIGVYNLSMTRWVMQQALGHCPDVLSINAHAVMGPSGVDHRVNAVLNFPEGITSQFICAFDGDAENTFEILGEHGRIKIHANFWEASTASVTLANAAPQVISKPFRINGFEAEIEEVRQCVLAGRIESSRMPHQETLQTLEWMDRIRHSIGLKYPFE